MGSALKTRPLNLIQSCCPQYLVVHLWVSEVFSMACSFSPRVFHIGTGAGVYCGVDGQLYPKVSQALGGGLETVLASGLQWT